jgi:hypothetical protein
MLVCRYNDCGGMFIQDGTSKNKFGRLEFFTYLCIEFKKVIVMENLRKYLRECIEKHPHLKSEILELYSLCASEIGEGGSESHEIELCKNSVNELIGEK